MVVGAIVDRVTLRWRPPTKVDAAMGVVETPTEGRLTDWLPVIGWLMALLGGRATKLTAFRAATEVIGGLAFAALAVAALTLADVNWLRVTLRALLIADLLLILRIDWQHHLIQDRTRSWLAACWRWRRRPANRPKRCSARRWPGWAPPSPSSCSTCWRG
jgi:hypothetical protein